MDRKLKVGISRDSFDEKGNFIIPGPGLKLLESIARLEIHPFESLHEEVPPDQIKDCDLVVNLFPQWTERTLQGSPRVIGVFRMGVGYDRIDVKALNRAGVLLFITPDGVRRPMAQAILTLLLALSMRLRIKDRMTREGRWDERVHFHGTGLTGKTLGSIGAGNIGKEMFLLAKPFGMRHIAFDPFIQHPKALEESDIQLVDFHTVLTESDFLTINCPLNEKTFHRIGEAELSKMKPTAFLINTARGAIVDEPALIRALQNGKIQGAGLDVFEKEPVSADNPLLKMENVILAPHALGWTDELFMGCWAQIVKQISQILQGEIPEGLVNPEVLENQRLLVKLEAVRIQGRE